MTWPPNPVRFARANGKVVLVSPVFDLGFVVSLRSPVFFYRIRVFNDGVDENQITFFISRHLMGIYYIDFLIF